jgi:hypothetical protein
MIKFGIKMICQYSNFDRLNDIIDLWCYDDSIRVVHNSLEEASKDLDKWRAGDKNSRYVIEPIND